MPTGSLEMGKGKGMFAYIVKTSTPDYSKQKDSIVWVTVEKIDVNLVQRMKISWNIIIKYIPEKPKTSDIETVLEILYIEKYIITIYRPGPPHGSGSSTDRTSPRPLIITLDIK